MKNLPKNENIYIYKNKLYIDYFKNGKRIRKSTGLNNSSLAFSFVKKHYYEFLRLKDIKPLKRAYFEIEDREYDKKLLQHAKETQNKVEYSFEKITKNILKEKAFLKESTNETYLSLRNMVLNFLKENELFYVSDFKREHSVLFFDFLRRQGFKQKTITALCFFMKSIFNYALENDFIFKNPFFVPKTKQSLNEKKNDFNVFSLDEMIELIKASRGDLRLFLDLAFFTGARTGEILALKYEDLDFNKDEIHIFKTLSSKGVLDSPKTKSSLRTIDMLGLVREELLPLKKEHSLNEFVIKTARRNLIKEFHTLLEKKQFSKRRLYDTRHSFASLMLSRGEEPMWVGCKMLGHKDLNETFKSYAKYLPKAVVHRATFLSEIDLKSYEVLA